MIAAPGYDNTENILEVEFTTGRIDQHIAAPPEVYQSLLHAESLGEYFNRKIRDRYRLREVTGGR